MQHVSVWTSSSFPAARNVSLFYVLRPLIKNTSFVGTRILHSQRPFGCRYFLGAHASIFITIVHATNPEVDHGMGLFCYMQCEAKHGRNGGAAISCYTCCYLSWSCYHVFTHALLTDGCSMFFITCSSFGEKTLNWILCTSDAAIDN